LSHFHKRSMGFSCGEYGGGEEGERSGETIFPLGVRISYHFGMVDAGIVEHEHDQLVWITALQDL